MKTIIRNKLYVKGPSSSSGGGGGGSVVSVTGNGNIIVDNTDPDNPVISTTARDITVVANYSALPSAATASDEFYWCSASQGTSWLPGALGGTYYSAGLYYSNGVSWEYLNVPYNATLAEVDTGTNDTKFLTPSTFTNAAKWATYLQHNVGRSGGTTLIGGTAQADKLIIQATSFGSHTVSKELFKLKKDGAADGPTSVALTIGDGDTGVTNDRINIWAINNSASTNYLVNAGATFSYFNASSDLRLMISGTGVINVSSSTATMVQGITISDAKNIVLNTTTGTKIGTATSQKLAFWNKTPIIQPTTSITGATLTGGGGTTITATDTFGGYTLQQIAAALINTGILA